MLEPGSDYVAAFTREVDRARLFDARSVMIAAEPIARSLPTARLSLPSRMQRRAGFVVDRNGTFLGAVCGRRSPQRCAGEDPGALGLAHICGSGEGQADRGRARLNARRPIGGHRRGRPAGRLLGADADARRASHRPARHGFGERGDRHVQAPTICRDLSRSTTGSRTAWSGLALQPAAALPADQMAGRDRAALQRQHAARPIPFPDFRRAVRAAGLAARLARHRGLQRVLARSPSPSWASGSRGHDHALADHHGDRVLRC